MGRLDGKVALVGYSVGGQHVGAAQVEDGLVARRAVLEQLELLQVLDHRAYDRRVRPRHDHLVEAGREGALLGEQADVRARQAPGRDVYERARRFTWEETARRTLDVYRELL